MRIDFQSICQEFNLGRSRRILEIKKGLINKKYLLSTSKGKFVLRISLRRTSRDLKFEVDLLNHLKNLPTPQLVRNKKGDYIGRVGERPFIIYRYISGQPVKRISMNLIKQIALFQAEFHCQGEKFKSKIKREPNYNLLPSKVKNLSKIIEKYFRGSLNDFKKIKKDLLAVKLSKNLPEGPIHVDIKPENTLVRNNKVVGILDFDNSYRGPFLIDIGKTLMWYCTKNKKLNKNCLDFFLKTYLSHRKLSKIELKHIYQAYKFAILSHIFIDYYKNILGIVPLKYLKYLIKNFYPATKV